MKSPKADYVKTLEHFFLIKEKKKDFGFKRDKEEIVFNVYKSNLHYYMYYCNIRLKVLDKIMINCCCENSSLLINSKS